MDKRSIFILVTIAVVTTSYFVFQFGTKGNDRSIDSPEASSLVASSEQQQINNRPTEGLSEQAEPVIDSGKDNLTQSNKTLSKEYDYLETLEKVSELQKQLIKLGYFVPPEYVAAYESYTEDALLQMAEYGDMVAIKTLQNRYAQAEQWDALRVMQEEAVRQGSVSDISDLHDAEFSKYSGEESRDSLLKSAAYAELAGLRGSSVTVHYAINNFNENGIEFSPSELDQISQLAKDMLNQINNERVRSGKEALGIIDDSQLISFMPDASTSGWGSKFVERSQE
ncbi:MAG: hypothetical protein HWE27_11905 [Gammaproteobacteria bacterium]|nr:hypothetical protein [Gammaproteobacteria bacterium]